MPLELDRIYVRDVMSRDIVTLGTSATIGEAAKLCLNRHIRHLPIVSAQGHVEGVISERDILGRIAVALRKGDSPHGLLCSDVMACEVISISPDATLGAAARCLKEKHIGCLPVLESDGYMIGLITRSDILGAVATKENNHPVRELVTW